MLGHLARRVFAPAAAAVVVIGGVTGIGAAPAAAQTASMVCELLITDDVNPPLELLDSHITHANGNNGTALCAGTIDGQIVNTARPGSWAHFAKTDDPVNCLSLAGVITGDTKSTIKVYTLTGQQKTLSLDGRFQAAGNVFTTTGELTGAGAFLPVPDKGDCVTQPITQIQVNFDAATIET